MRIESIELSNMTIPLKKPFKIAFWIVEVIETIVVKMTLEDGSVGLGTAFPTPVITGDTSGSIRGAITEVLAPQLVGMDITDYENVLKKINGGIVGNSSAKAALDMAVYDLVAQLNGLPLYKMLGGNKQSFESDITVSVNSAQEMSEDAQEYMANGFRILKVKVGLGADIDIMRVKSIRDAVGPEITLRLDANQGWTAKEAVRVIRKIEDMGLNIELVEQPVDRHDLHGLKFVTDNVITPIMADESIFTPEDALRIVQMRAADMINIKLMKSGGIHNALKINSIAESAGVECMVGCMIENRIGISAAAHFAAAKKNVTRMDLDSPFLLAGEPVEGGFSVDGPRIVMSQAHGLGITKINNIDIGMLVP